MPSRPLPPLPAGVFLLLAGSRGDRVSSPRASPGGDPVALEELPLRGRAGGAPARMPIPPEVLDRFLRVVPGASRTVVILGLDAEGEVEIEMRMKESRYDPRIAERIGTYCARLAGWRPLRLEP